MPTSTPTKTKINENSQVSPFLVFFLITAMQFGVGILGFARYITGFAGYDAWISVLLSGLSTNIILWLIYKIIEHGNGNDIITIHRELFGKWLGGLLSLGILSYFFIYVVTIIRSYIEVIQIWLFPQFSTWELAFLILLLAYTFVVGGFRTVAGMSFLSIVYGGFLMLIVYFPLEYAHFSNLLPFFDHSVPSLLMATKQMILSFLGFELIFIYYPFIKRPDQSKKWAHAATMYTTFIYVVIVLVIFVYFSERQLSHTIWSTLSLWKIAKLPIIERFEYVGVSIWIFIILPNICLGVWTVTRGLKLQFPIRQRTVLPFVLIVILIITGLFKNRTAIDKLNSTVSIAGLYFVYCYIPFLFIYQWLFQKVKKYEKH
ncbi:GerAB/ArcD/ProY family transporter [Scopulibacillus cellulosilyticus]|uniref:GerAB/ArcD/ProY family transporter n=1 Tax=Scopulibacillus cellulosilyticus TaxID=2665665 RepID=A0ABW2Q1R2_9BACL